MTVHLAVPLQIWSFGLIAALFSTLAFTYTSCVHNDHCKAWLPMISDTWVYPPENYVSRWMVGNLCICLGVSQWAIFHFDQGGLSSFWNKALLWMGFASCVFLSGVGAVCESTGPTCRGNDTVHTTFAVTFFIGYNLMMIIILCTKPDPVGAPSGRGIEIAALAGSMLCKLRFSGAAWDTIDSYAANGFGSNALPIVEWGDVILVAIWTVTYLYRRGKDYRFGIINRNSDAADTPTPLSFWSFDFCAWIVAIWYFGTLITTASIYKAEGRWPQGGIPYISDTWVYAPGNWVSRWAVVGCATVGAFGHALVYYLEKDAGSQGRTTQGGALTILAVCAMFGISVVGCVDESENINIHVAAASVFFAGYDLFMVLIARQLLKGDDLCKGILAAVMAVVSLAAKLRFHPASRDQMSSIWAYIPQALEWLDALVIGVFFTVYILSFNDERRKNIGLAFFKVSSKEVQVFP